MPTIAIRIDPKPFARPRFNSITRAVFNSSSYTNYKIQLQWVMKEQWKALPLQGEVDVEIDFYIKKPASVRGSNDRRFPHVKPDLDNLMKAVFDAANGVLWDDDGQVVTVICRKRYSDSGSIVIQVTKTPPGA